MSLPALKSDLLKPVFCFAEYGRSWIFRGLEFLRSIAPAGNNLLWFQINPDADFSTARAKANPANTQKVEPEQQPSGPSPAWIFAEIVFVFLLFGLFAGQLPPDVNESHYLTKAKHFWDPQWCSGDVFLSSAFSHWLFYFSAGWATKFMSLTAFAWTGRILTWALLAIAWRRLSWSLIPKYGFALISAALFLILNDRFHLAGEWVVGGFEAKGISYALIMFALREMLRDNMVLVWPLVGLASAFHVLAGGWALLAFIFCFVVSRILSPRPTGGLPSRANTSEKVKARPSRMQTSLAIAVGGIFFLVGALPPLLVDFSADPEISLAASNVYVHSRISHHLLFGSFPTIFVGRFVLMMIGWAIVGVALMRYRPALKLQLFCIGSLLISLAGLLLSGMAEQDGATGDFACRLLRFYWFRLADFALPAAFSLSTTVILGHWIHTPLSTTRYRNVAVFSSIMILIAAVMLIFERNADPRPRADRRSLPQYDSEVDRTLATFKNWKKACEWISKNTPDDSVFITPARQQTFKWYAGRTEIACWKDIPQDAAGILEWNQRLDAVYFPQTIYPAGLMSYDDQQLKELAARFNADYFLLPQYQVDLANPPTEIEQVYPEPGMKATYVVLKIGENEELTNGK